MIIDITVTLLTATATATAVNDIAVTVVLNDEVVNPEETFCERVDDCLDIPSTNGNYVLKILNGVKSWVAESGGGVWGSITGTITNQTDLVNYITTRLTGYATEAFVTSQGYITNVVTALGYTPEDEDKKTDSFTDSSTDNYTSAKALVDGLAAKSAEGVMDNGKIDVTVASNNITVAIKSFAGADPSATNPVYVVINGVVRTITSALSVTRNAGTNWFGNGLNFECDYFVYLGYNATDGVVIGFSPILGNQYSDFSTTTTAFNYAAISNTTTASSTDKYVVIGRFAATLGVAASYNWSVPTFTPSNLIQTPIDKTRWLNYGSVTTITGFSAITTAEIIYKVHDRMVFSRIYFVGTSNATTATYTMPIPPNITTTSNGICIVNNGSLSNNSGRLQGSIGSTTFNVYRDISQTAWTAFGIKQFFGTSFYAY